MAKVCPSEPGKIQKVRTHRKGRTVKALREAEFGALYAQLLEDHHDPAAAFTAATTATPGIGQERRLELLAAMGLPLPTASTGERGRPRSEDLDRWETTYRAVRDDLLHRDAITYGGRDADALATVEADIARVAWVRAMDAVKVSHESARSRLRRAGLPVPTWPRKMHDPMPETSPVLQMLPAQLAMELPFLAERRAVRRANDSGRTDALLRRWETDYAAAIAAATAAQMYGGARRGSGKLGHGGGRQSVAIAQAHAAATGQ